jgi:hypothetical protein
MRTLQTEGRKGCLRALILELKPEQLHVKVQTLLQVADIQFWD